MTIDPKAEAALALHRFGLGPRAGSIAAIASDPRGALIAELERPGAARIADAGLPSSAAAARAALEFQEKQRIARQARQRVAQQNGMADPSAEPQMSEPPGTPATPAPQATAKPAPPANNGPAVPQQLYLAEARARIHAALGADIGFAERLTWFWSNHFCVSADKGGVRPICGAYEREAIRPHVLGRFGDMLQAVETHPAMLIYLDNARSIGPDSVAGQRRRFGLNENLAREILELHTVGVRSVYTQEDVTRLAKVITGWTVIGFRQDPARAGEFVFNPNMHQPGPQTVIGKTYPDAGFEQGRAVLATLARHPATARHVATKLARHFVADVPPPTLVERLSRRFLDTQGDLKEVTRALVMSDETWSAPRSKLKRPGEWLIGALRAAGVTPPDVGPVMGAHNLLGEPIWRPPAPKGFSDDSAVWLDGLSQRVDVANQMARRISPAVDPKMMFEMALAPLASVETRQAVSRAESRQQALALLLLSPEFQRR
ncbi:MAG: DUF1800 family protein [Xanthobacteraceae bacterium]